MNAAVLCFAGDKKPAAGCPSPIAGAARVPRSEPKLPAGTSGIGIGGTGCADLSHPAVRRINDLRGLSHPGHVRSQADQDHNISCPSSHARRTRGRDVACYVSTECTIRTVRGNIPRIVLRCAPQSIGNLDRCSGFIFIILQSLLLESGRLLISSKPVDSWFPQSRSLLLPIGKPMDSNLLQLLFPRSQADGFLFLESRSLSLVLTHAGRTKKPPTSLEPAGGRTEPYN